MQQNEIVHIINKFFQRLGKLLNQIENDFDEDSIHDFRKEVKKLRAFLRLISLNRGIPDDLKLPHKLKKIYLLAGKIRDLQLHLHFINDKYTEEDKPSEYLLLLQNEMEKWIKKLQIVLKENQLLKIEKKITGNLPEQVRMETIKEFFQKKIMNIDALQSARKVTDEDLHSIRKNIKDINYDLKILNDNDGISIPFLLWDNEEIKKAENMAQELGLYNDIRTALLFMQPAYLNKINESERKRLQAIRKQWSLEKKSTKQNISEKLRHLFLKATNKEIFD